MPGIPFIKDFKFDYGTAMEVTPLVRRVVAHNPSPFTFKGTGTYIIGHGKVAIVDPGPDMQDHIDAVLRAVRGETVTHILVTHTHLDHVPATPRSIPMVRIPGRRATRSRRRRAISRLRPTSSSTTATSLRATAGTSRRSTRPATSPTICASR
jgi:glyoxylase-like metal-dependent hydrolase (beta-lactamase superfamily II)